VHVPDAVHRLLRLGGERCGEEAAADCREESSTLHWLYP
jgi:hypothetical protein